MTNTSKEPSSNLLGELIKRIRTTNNLTQGNFGKIFEPSVTQSTVARWEKGELTPDMMHFPKIASLLNLSFEEFIEFIERSTSKIEDLDIENKTLTYNKRHLSILKKGVRTWNNWRNKNPDVIPQLSGITLKQGEFDNLDGYNLDRANLAGLRGVFISIQNASLIEANMEKAKLEGGSFIGSNFSRANLKKIIIQHTCLGRAIFEKANLSGANVYYSDFKEAKLIQCSIYGSSFIQTNLESIETDNIFVSPDGFEGISANDLAQAQYTYLQRYHPLLTQKFVSNYNLETEIVKYSQILVSKYGNYRYKKKFSLFTNHRCLNIISLFVNIFKDDNYL